MSAQGIHKPTSNQLSVTDGGFTEEGRAEITFTKVTAGSFTASDISPDLLTDSSSKVVLFKSQAGVARSDQARKKIQLKKNGEVLIAHCPSLQPIRQPQIRSSRLPNHELTYAQPIKHPTFTWEEISVFPPSVAEVETAIPAFIGYTEKAINKTADDLILVPTKIQSLKDYELYFGGPSIGPHRGYGRGPGRCGLQGHVVYRARRALHPLLQCKALFDNGGGQCYITSVGTLSDACDD